MSILGCYGEDIDFPNGTQGIYASAVAGLFRSGFSRAGIRPSSAGQTLKTSAFPNGPVSSCWASVRTYYTNAGSAIFKIFGLSQVSLGNGDTGLWVTAGNGSAKLSLYKFVNGTPTLIAQEAGASLRYGLNFVSMQVVNYGASCTVNVFLDGMQLISYTGDVSVAGMSQIDCVVASGYAAQTNIPDLYNSEFIVADEDVRSFPGLMTLALTGAGTTDQWMGVFSTINQTTLSDTTPNYTNTSAQDQQFNVTDLLSGVFDIKAIKITARAAKSAASTPTKIALGYNNGGTVAVGAAQALTTAYATYESLDTIDPTKSAAWSQVDMNALQVNVRSVT